MVASTQRGLEGRLTVVGLSLRESLGGGEFSGVWLARDRKCVLKKTLRKGNIGNRISKDKRHVVLKILSSYTPREVETGRLRERDILYKSRVRHLTIVTVSGT